MSEEKKLHIDEDWKSQVEAEKQAAKQPEPSTPGEGATPDSSASPKTPTDETVGPPDEDDPPMPPASIGMLMSSLATEALIAMGQFPHPATGETINRRNQAKYLVDTLELLQEKTAGNLSDEEAAALKDVLHQLRMAFVSGRPNQPGV